MMEKKSNNGSGSPCYEKFLNCIRSSRAYRAICYRASHEGPGTAPWLPPPPPKKTKSLTITAVENGKEKDVLAHGNNDDHVPVIIKPAKIAPATENAQEKNKAQVRLENHRAGQNNDPFDNLGTASNVEQKLHLRTPTRKGSAGDHIENQFTEYIKRAKQKLRATSNVGGGAGKGDSTIGSGKTTVDDHFTNYINRAKMKLRTTSSIGGGKAHKYK